MKKFFTLLAVAAMAVAANAQDNIYKSTGDNVPAETVLVDNDALSVTTVYAADGKTISALTDGASEFKTIGGIEFPGYFQLRVAADPKGDDLTGTDNGGSTPLVVVVKQKLTLAVYNRRQKGNDGYNPGDNKGLLCVNQAGLVKVTGTTSEPTFDDPDNDAFGYCVESFDLEPATYTLYRKGSTMQIYGFSWTVEGGETPEPAGDELSVVPSGVSPNWQTNYDAIKGNVELDGLVMNCSGFPFADAKFSVELKIREGQENQTRPIYNVAPKTGFVETGDSINNYNVKYPTYRIENQPEEIILTIDGVNAVKYKNFDFMFGTTTDAQFTPEENGNGYYETRMLYLRGEYQQFVDGAWGEVAKYQGYVYINVNVPAGEKSNIEVVEAAVIDENAPVEYYNLQGVRINEPAAGQIVIRRQGANVTKMVVR